MQFTIPASESVYVTRNDRIGFTFYDVIATIPSSFSGDHKSYMLALSGDQRPQIGEEHNFDSLPMPKQYSVGITVDTSKGHWQLNSNQFWLKSGISHDDVIKWKHFPRN